MKTFCASASYHNNYNNILLLNYFESFNECVREYLLVLQVFME